MIRFPWLRRYRRWIVAGVIVAILPVVAFVSLNRRQKELIDDLRLTSVRERPRPLLASAAARLGRAPNDLPWLCWEFAVPDTVQIPAAGGLAEPADPEPEVRRAVRALNRVGGARCVRLNGYPPFDNPKSIRPLSELHGLERLELSFRLHDDELKALADIHGLRELRLPSLEARSFARAVEPLAALPRLERLELLDSLYNEEDIAAIARLRGLRVLVLDGHDLIDASELKPLAALPRLERLSLVGTARQFNTIDGSFERDVLPLIAAMPSLKELRVGLNGGIPPARIAKLESARSGLKVIEVKPADLRGNVPW